jgi:hypothetical protein
VTKNDFFINAELKKEIFNKYLYAPNNLNKANRMNSERGANNEFIVELDIKLVLY